MIGALLRRYIFRIIDSINGGAIKRHYQDIKDIMNGDSVNTIQLNKLLIHAKKTVPFYKEINSNDLNQFPVVTKNDYRDNYNLFKSEKYLNKPLHRMSTSGSTGIPFIILQDMNKRKRTVAELIYFNEIAGQRLGERFLYIKAWPQRKSRLESIKQNVIPIDILHLNEETLEKVRDILKKDTSVRSVLAYASSYEKLADYLLEKGDTPEMFNIKVLFSSSSLLSEDTKKV